MSVVVSWRVVERGRGVLDATALVVSVLMLATPIQAQNQGATAAPSLGLLTAVSAEWLQVGAGSLHRDAAPSLAVAVAHDRPNGLRLEVGYLRAARRLSTAKGVTGSVSMPLTGGRFTVRPGVGAFIGRAVSTIDDGGYAWQSGTPDSTTGYQKHQRYMHATTVGAAANLGAEVQVIPALAITASVRQWIFTGHAMSPDRTSTLAGLGLSFHPGALIQPRGSRTELAR